MGCGLLNTEVDLSQAVESMREQRQQDFLSLAAFYPGAYLHAINSELGKVYAETGEQVQSLIGPAIAEAVGAQPDPSFHPGKWGVDGRLLAGDTVAIVEVKTTWDKSESFASKLNPDTQQCSDRWLATRGEDPSRCIVLGVLVDRGSQTADVYVRMDSDAKDWVKVLDDVDLGLE